jgi:hypothetical protein
MRIAALPPRSGVTTTLALAVTILLHSPSYPADETGRFWTGVNYEWRGRQNIFDGLDIEDVLAKVEMTCREHLTIKFFKALTLLIESRR